MSVFIFPSSPISVPGVATEVTLASVDATLTTLEAKSAAGMITEAFDENVIAYVGATTKVDTVTYKLASATVATQTMTYDGSDRLIRVLKS